MKEFKDADARTWELRVNVASIARVRDKLDVDLPGLFADRMAGLAAFLDDPVKVVQVLWVLVESQADKKSVKPETFGEAFSGDVLEGATNALLEELANFSPSAKAKAIRAMLAKMRETAEKLTEIGMQKIEALDVTAVAEKLQKTLAEKSSGLPGAAPESSASILVHSHSEN